MNRIITGNSFEVMRQTPDNTYDAGVTDPPYELGFMAKHWDRTGIAYEPRFWFEVLRTLKPGAHLVTFGATRTHHRMVCAIEDAGFEIRDEIDWVFGSGFPKSSNQEGEWEGYGTALKPAKEPICLARKPLIGTVPENLAQHRTGALNIDASRIPGEKGSGNWTGKEVTGKPGELYEGGWKPDFTGEQNALGRWPANLAHDGSPEVVALFPAEAGAAAPVSGDEPSSVTNSIFGKFNARLPGAFYADAGSAARFFYCAKATQEDRDAGLEIFRATTVTDGRAKTIDNAYQRGATLRRNTHPTVKPTALMRWLCRLVTPKGGHIIDPFLGSGSTGRGAVLEGFTFTGIERESEYAAIARARVIEAAGEMFAQIDCQTHPSTPP
jgi:site-specific DNA-methyltransferase (adenine-specific)